ncbi:hypothetical protein [Aurantimonas sp. HBX-1]|uniref:hypothetical protein n=1 Tax=Aurantimonas sp. HBX-1 TaxID=2906072 RepID=UPI001F1B783E|nr:hypothetical protein [Aurantimonas sp. HBX-1]UIJ73325.1 hypothetical protein LXB15_06690 [Aurantimonas sp. HBX-1]
MIMPRTLPILYGSAIALLSSTSAFAVEAEPFAERLSAVLEKQNLSIDYAGAEERGDDVVLSDVTFSVDGTSVEAGDLLFEGVTGSREEGYEIKRFSTDLERDNAASGWKVDDFTLESIDIAGSDPASTTPTSSDLYFESATLGGVQVTESGKVSFSLTGAEIDNAFSDKGVLTSNFDLGNFMMKPAIGEDEPSLVTKLDYEELRGSASGKASWDSQTGELKIDQVQLAVEDAGTLTFSESISGYTPDFIQSAMQLQQRMADKPDNTEAWTAGILGLISQLKLGELELSYEDASLVDRLLSHYAELGNQSVEQLVATLDTMVPAMLAGFQNEEMQNDIAAAVSRFLKDPQSITISIDPTEPVPAPQILGAALGAPATLPGILNLDVTANQ